jgi:maltose alpha-D-glucosyltransferase/alpha-amylase
MVRLLGERTAELHLALGSESSNRDLAPEEFTTLYQRSVYQSLRSLFRRVMSTAKKQVKKLDENLSATLGEIIEREGEVLTALEQIKNRKIKANKIRIHGDYHLGQVLFTGRDFMIIDLEGEPARTLSERRLKYSAFRDVAGMIRSFHYAAYGGFLSYVGSRTEDARFLEPFIEPWYMYASGTFLQAYLSRVGDAAFVPDNYNDRRLLLDVFVLEKAIYELGYEVDNRPEWLMIPARGVLYTLDSFRG